MQLFPFYNISYSNSILHISGISWSLQLAPISYHIMVESAISTGNQTELSYFPSLLKYNFAHLWTKVLWISYQNTILFYSFSQKEPRESCRKEDTHFEEYEVSTESISLKIVGKYMFNTLLGFAYTVLLNHLKDSCVLKYCYIYFKE